MQRYYFVFFGNGVFLFGSGATTWAWICLERVRGSAGDLRSPLLKNGIFNMCITENVKNISGVKGVVNYIFIGG